MSSTGEGRALENEQMWEERVYREKDWEEGNYAAKSTEQERRMEVGEIWKGEFKMTL